MTIIRMLIAILIGSGFISYHFVFQQPGVKYSITTREESAYNIAKGLEFHFAINTTQLKEGEAIKVTLDEINTTPNTLNISSKNIWKLPNPTLGPCSRVNYPFGIEVIRGYYTQSNISDGEQLQFYPSGVYACPATYNVKFYIFEPLSDLFTINPQLPFSHASYNVTNSGFFKLTGSFPLQPGIYTVAAADEWGEILVLHFSLRCPSKLVI
jgi:hypothetical protein